MAMTSTKNRLLALLEESRGHISGEFIAGELKVSRTAVWKAVNELRKDGYKITATTRNGYRFAANNDILSEVGIRACLRKGEVLGSEAPVAWASSPTLGGRPAPLTPPFRVHFYDETESTNVLAKQAAIAGAGHFYIILADHQTGGRGRYGKKFFSPPGCGIYMSFVLRPTEVWLKETPTLVTPFAAVAVCEAIETVCGKKPKIKWVNDIFLDGKKICGISNEAGTDFVSGEISWIVTGIGVNFRTPEGGFPDEICEIAGAIFGKKRAGVTRNRLAAEIIKNMSKLQDPVDFLEKYRARMMFLGEKIKIHNTANAYEFTTATALDIDDTGRLVVQRENGEIFSLSSGEVSVRSIRQ